MHRYLRAIGFSGLKNRKELQQLITDCIRKSEQREYVSCGDSAELLVESRREIADGIGIAVRGNIDEENNYIYSYYFPYIRGMYISSGEDVTVERHAEKESYAGVCDDIRVGVSLIFYFQNVISYLKYKNRDELPVKGTSLILGGLSCDGMIMMPIVKNEQERKNNRKFCSQRNSLIQAARKGDEDAMESLTMEDMDTYTTISKRILEEDVFTLVDTCFMPYGVECDQYSILAEIMECHKIKNNITEEELWRMTLSCNEIIFDLCINAKDLMGEPMAGRRFKGTVWLQGLVNFPDA